MKKLAKLTLILFVLLLTACNKDDGDNSFTKDKKLASLLFAPNIQGERIKLNYIYDDQGRLTEIEQESPYLKAFVISYMADGRVEKIKAAEFNSAPIRYIDYTFFYENESKIPNRIRYSGAVPTYTADILNIDNTLLWNNKDGDEFVLEGVNATNNTFQSLTTYGITITPHFNTQFKNGLATQAVLNIPLAMTLHYVFFVAATHIPLNSQPIIRMESSNGDLYNWQYETDAAGYITKDKTQGGIEYLYQ